MIYRHQCRPLHPQSQPRCRAPLPSLRQREGGGDMWLAALRDSVRGGKGIVRGDLLQGDPLHRRLDHSGGGIGIGIAHHLQPQPPNSGRLLPRRLRHLRSLWRRGRLATCRRLHRHASRGGASHGRERQTDSRADV